MIVVLAMYEKSSPDDRFDMAYLLQTRIPFVKRTLEPYGLTDIEVRQRVSGFPPGSAGKYYCIIVLHFATLDGLRRSLVEQGERLNAGIRDFTDIEPVVMVTEPAAL